MRLTLLARTPSPKRRAAYKPQLKLLRLIVFAHIAAAVLQLRAPALSLRLPDALFHTPPHPGEIQEVRYEVVVV